MDSLNNALRLKRAVRQFNLNYNGKPVNYLKPKQISSIYSIQKCDTFVTLPTGYGKSLIYEISPFYSFENGYKQKCIVICPLNAIIDQEIQKFGNLALKITDENCDAKISDSILYVFGHPEMVLSKSGFEILEKIVKKEDKVLVCVDEAHCVIEWGREFRPFFQEIGTLKTLFSVNFLCMTATITDKGRQQISKILGLKSVCFIGNNTGVNPNITLSVTKRPAITGGKNTVEGSFEACIKPYLLELYIEKQDFPITLIYSKLKWCGYGMSFARRILGNEIYDGQKCPQNSRVVQFHAPLTSSANSYILQCLKDENCKIRMIFATVALGMGADLQHVRRIIHVGPPSTMESYVQELGRAGRDGAEAEAILFVNASDAGDPHLDIDMKDYLKSDNCRRSFINNYFKSDTSSIITAKCCDVCIKSENINAPLTVALDQQQTLRCLLHSYVEADITGELDFKIGHKINFIVDIMELIKSADHLKAIMDVDTDIAESLYLLIQHTMQKQEC